MTIDEAINHYKKEADKYYEYGIEAECYEIGKEYEQLAEWLTELKDLREENKVLMQECDRLIKEKGELLSKVSGGDVLRICQLEEQLQAELDNSHCLEIELKEAKRLLKVAVEDFAVYGALKDLSSEQRVQNPDWRRFNRVFDVLDYQWRYANEALKLLNDEK